MNPAGEGSDGEGGHKLQVLSYDLPHIHVCGPGFVQMKGS